MKLTAIEEHALTGSRCPDCSDVRFPPRTVCPRCGGTELLPEPIASGTVAALSTSPRGPVALVRAAQGPQVLGLVDDGVQVGDIVEADIAEGALHWRRRRNATP